MQKIYYMGKEVRDARGRFSSFRKNMFWFLKRVLLGIAIVFFLTGVYVAGGYGNPVVKAELIKEGIPPVLQRIAKCESNNQHFGKSGQVLMTGNTNKTVDVGRYAINSVWFHKATELGYDLTDEKDNEEMAVWIYRERGTGDWSASAYCWKK